jgi:hypothetical protein
MAVNWDLYEDRLTINGTTQRDRIINETKNNITSKIVNSPSYQVVAINSVSSHLVVNSLSGISTSDSLNTKQINSIPDESFNLGDVISWDSYSWLVTEVDNDNEIYTKGKMTQCNYTIKFQNKLTGDILSYPSIVEFDGGSFDYNNNQITTLNSTSKIKLRFDQFSSQLTEGDRLILDWRNTNKPNTYKISSAIQKSYDGTNGIIELVLDRDEFTPEIDNLEYKICNYFEVTHSEGTAEILYSGDCVIKVGGSYKTFTCKFVDSEGTELDLTPIWSMTSSITDAESYFTTVVDNTNNSIKIKCSDNESLIGSTLTLNLTESTGTYNASLEIEVISL